MTVAANGAPLLKATISESLYGFWIADIEVDSLEDLTGPIVLDIEGITFTGAIFSPGGRDRSGVESGRWIARIVGGAAGMGTAVGAKNFNGVNVRGLIDELLAAAGETLDVDASDSTILIRPMAKWHRIATTAGNALAELLDEVSSSARMQRNGQVKIGVESFAALDIDTKTDRIISETPDMNRQLFAPLQPVIIPGVTIEDRRVSYVLTTVTGGGLRQEVWYEDA